MQMTNKIVTMMHQTFLSHKLCKSLLLTMLLVLTPIMAGAKIYLLSVGISDYPGIQNDLRLPHNDAATMQWLYKENKQAKTVLLMNDKATVSNVKTALKNMAAKATANDNCVLFFSGHGVKGGFVCYDGFLTYADVASALSACKSNNKMVFADACFSGAIRDNSGVSAKYDSWNHNIMLFLSCRSNEVSIETPTMTNGFFTYALQHGLRGGADKNKDRTITAKELFNYVSAKVKKESNNRQHPVMWGKFPDTMPLIKW